MKFMPYNVLKRIICTSLLLIITIGLGACGTNEKTDEENKPTVMENITAEELTGKTGIVLTPPEGATAVTYCVLNIDDSNPIAEMCFTLDGVNAFERAQLDSKGAMSLTGSNLMKSEAYNITGFTYEWVNVSSVAGSVFGKTGNDAIMKTCDGAGYFAWVDGNTNILYNIGIKGYSDYIQLIKLAKAVF